LLKAESAVMLIDRAQNRIASRLRRERGLHGGEVRPSVPSRYRHVRTVYEFVATGRVCEVDVLTTEDLDVA
jgi:hypothetical protein